MDENIALLEQEYNPPLDPTLIYAIYSDYHGEDGALRLAREALDMLKEEAVVEQLDADFDASGSGGGAARKEDSEDVGSSSRTVTGTETETDESSISNGVAGLGIRCDEEALAGQYYKDAERLDASTKELMLAETFPTLRAELIRFTLKKCNDDYERATDELLNHVWVEDVRASPGEEGDVARGIDAFSEEHHVPRRRKQKQGKKRKQKWDSCELESFKDDLPATPANKWSIGSQDVDFIASRTNLAPKTISSIYHENGAALAPTLYAILRKDIVLHGNDEPESSHLQSAVELSDEFPALDLPHALALTRLTYPSSTNAHQLAKALSSPPTSASYAGKPGPQDLIPQYVPLDLSSPLDSSSHPLPVLSPSMTSHTTASLSQARSSAFTSASAYHRAGKSQPLMRAAAAYYASVGHAYTPHLQALSAADADRIVDAQPLSSANYVASTGAGAGLGPGIDLHGVDVRNAVRISLARVRSWWDALGEARLPGVRSFTADRGFTIITGRGVHSAGKVGRLGPAVVKALVGEGWRVEVGGGWVVVRGRIARRA